jgi:hypothetical protein
MKVVRGIRSGLPKTVASISVAAAMALLFSCHNYLNPGDPKATNYQQFQTVATPAEVVPETPVYTATILWPVFRCSSCPAVDAYGMQVSSSSTDWSTPAYQIAVSSGNSFSTTDMSLVQGTYFWHIRVRNRSTQQWTDWGTPSAFTLSGVLATGIAPVVGGTTADTTPLLDWGDLTGAAGYQMQMATTEAALPATTPIAVTTSKPPLRRPRSLPARASSAHPRWPARTLPRTWR